MGKKSIIGYVRTPLVGRRISRGESYFSNNGRKGSKKYGKGKSEKVRAWARAMGGRSSWKSGRPGDNEGGGKVLGFVGTL